MPLGPLEQLLIIIIFLITFVLLFALSIAIETINIVSVPPHSMPGRGIRLSIENAVKIFLLVILSFGLVGAVAGGLSGAIVGHIGLGMISGAFLSGFFSLSVGIYASLRCGGFGAIQHVVLRLIIWETGGLPRHAIRFLDYATNRVFLRRVGGGYIFIHRSLMEHFANLTDEDIDRIFSD